jgi:hypothetical protein
MNLFQLTRNYIELVELSDQMDQETFVDTLESIQEPLEKKMTNIVKVIRSIESDVEFIKKEEARLKELKASKANAISRLKDMLHDSVLMVGEKTKTGGHKLTIKDDPYVKSIYTQKNPPGVELLDAQEVPDDYKIPQEPKIDNKAIIEAWKNDVEVKGVVVSQGVGVRFK